MKDHYMKYTTLQAENELPEETGDGSLSPPVFRDVGLCEREEGDREPSPVSSNFTAFPDTSHTVYYYCTISHHHSDVFIL